VRVGDAREGDLVGALDAHNAAGGYVRMAIGPFFSNGDEVREFPVAEYSAAALRGIPSMQSSKFWN
jgi:hypothetical protein